MSWESFELQFDLKDQTCWRIFQRFNSKQQPQEIFYKKSVPRNFTKFIEKHLWQSLFFKKETLEQVFSCEFCEISKNTFFTEHARQLLLTLAILSAITNLRTLEQEVKQTFLRKKKLITFWKIEFCNATYGFNTLITNVRVRVKKITWNTQCVKSVQMRNFFWSVFYHIWTWVSLRIQSKCRKIRTRKNSVFGHFSRSEGFHLVSIKRVFTALSNI